MKTINQVESILNKMGIETIHEKEEEGDSDDYHFDYNDWSVWCLEDADNEFVGFGVLNAYGVSDENRVNLLEIASRFNGSLKYVKVLVFEEWVHLTIEQMKYAELTESLLRNMLNCLTECTQEFLNVILNPEEEE